MNPSARVILVGFGLLAVLLGAVALVYLPPSWSTVLVGGAALVFLLVRPRQGLLLLLAALYVILLPNVTIGALEASVTSFMTLGLFVGTLAIQRRDASLRLARWQAFLLVALGMTFLLSTAFSASINMSLLGVPNLVVYLMLLYVFMVLVREPEQLWDLARGTLVLAFIISIWRIELRPLRYLFGLPSLGINGAVFICLPAVAVGLVMATMPPTSRATPGIRAFSWLTIISVFYHGLLYQTRAGWLAWAAIIAVLALETRGRTRATLALAVIGVSAMAMFVFADVIQDNLAQTRATVQAASGELPYESASSDDVVRLVARDAGLRMFHARPVVGWGPNSYVRLKPAFVDYPGKEARSPGAFNSWLIALAEWGVLGTAVSLAAFLVPLLLALRAIRRVRNPTTMLALGFAVGLLGLSVHLLFVDLMYSFAWAHVGMALAASRLAMERAPA